MGMSLDETAKESNILDSLKKYFVDSLETVEGLNVSFDKYLSTPNTQGHAVDKWVSINVLNMNLSDLSGLDLNIFCCTRSDGEGFKRAQLRDKVFKYLTDNTKTDGMARIAFYRSRADGNWTLLPGGFVVLQPIPESNFTLEDGTKVKHLVPRLRFSSKV
jgi:hypothetical protein